MPHKTEEPQAQKKQYMNTILVGLLIIAAFLIGNLWTSVQYLKKGYGENNTGTQAAVGNNDQAAAQPTPQKATGEVPKVTDEDWVKGDRNAEIALIEYSDFECPFCKQFHPTAQQVVDSYPGKVMWVYRHFPLAFHQNAQKEAEGAECVGEQGGNEAFWKFTDAIYERTTSNGLGFALDKLGPLAAELGYNQTAFQTCLDSGKYAQKVTDQMAGGQAAGVSGTPGNILLNVKTGETQLLPGAVPFASVKSALDQMLAQ